MMLRDATAWPCEVLSDTLGLPSVDVLPVAPSPFFAKHQEFPNPVAYIPQLVAEYSSDMVGIVNQFAHLNSCCNISLTVHQLYVNYLSINYVYIIMYYVYL